MRLARHRRSLIHEARAKVITSTGMESTASGARFAVTKPVSTTETTATHRVAGRSGSMRKPHPAPVRAR
ncbi:hypothetical protein AS029_07405 [Microbacterium enclense]|nr:hypothetical protein AS029_07405 [Microbacterium enclense]